MVSHPEPDVLESKVKWALGSTAVNKASGYDRIPVKLFKTLKDDAIKLFTFNMSAILEDPAVVNPHPNSKKGSTKECANHRTIALISRASKVMLKILHARLQHYAKHGLPDDQAGFRKDRRTRDQIANIC